MTSRTLAPALALFVAVHALAPSAAHAQNCVGTGFGCTAGEFGLPTLSVVSISEPCEYVGDTATVNLRATYLPNTPRYDIGLHIALDGGDAQTGLCQRSILTPLATPCGNAGSPLTGVGPYFNGECSDAADTCGDVQGTTTHFDQTVTIACRDLDGDGTVDLASVVSWNQNQNTTCSAAAPPGPGTSSKCNRGTLTNITGLPVPSQTIEVVKVLGPAANAGTFDLQIDAVTFAGGVGNGGTTGPEEVTPGTHTVRELAANAAFPLSGYTSGIACVDQVGRCPNAPATRCLVNAACGAGTCNLTPTAVASCSNCTTLDVPVPTEQATIVCTITNNADDCGGQACVCTNDQPPGGVDQGCQTILNACDTPVVNGEGAACVDCLVTPDCSIAGDVCNTATKECVPCNDTGNGAQDEGCESTTLNACKTPGVDAATCVDCTVDADCPQGDRCKIATNTCVECLSDADCAGGVCDLVTNTCIECRNTALPGGVDEGCETVINACDTTVVGGVGTDCVDCLVTADCSIAGDVCDTAAKVCEPCVDGTAGGQDDGCEDTTLNACLEEETGERICVDCTIDSDCEVGDLCRPDNICVECIDDGDCGGGELCDEPSGICTACIDDASFPDTDSGCVAESPVCVEQGGVIGGGGTAVFVCVHCEDDMPADTETDEGCTSVAPICEEDVPGGRCVECNDAADCAEGEVCDVDAGICVICLDDHQAGTIDTGCDTALPVCELGADGTADDHCGECEDDKGPGLTDWGCDELEPFCDDTVVSGAICNECERDLDCAEGLICVGGSCVDPGQTVATGDEVVTPEDVPTTFDPRDNDSGANGSPLTITRIVSGPSNGEASTDGESISYAPDANYNGPDALVYEVCDEGNQCATATVSITVTPVNDAPDAIDDLLDTPEDTAVLIVVVANDVDGDSPVLDVTRIVEPGEVVSAPSFGTAVIRADNTVLYTPSANFTGRDAFGYELCDEGGLCDIANVLIEVRSVNDGPVAGDDATTTPAGTAVNVPVLDNDGDVDGDPLEVARIVFPPGEGTAEIEADGTITYTPGGATGVVTFSYEVCDAELCDIAEVRIDVGSDNVPPAVADDDDTTPIDEPVTIDVLANDDDPEGGELTITQVGQPPSGEATLNDDGTITFTPAPGFTGETSFTYTACDEAGACETGVVTVTVVPGDNRPPLATDDVVSTRVNVPVNLDPTDNDVDPDGDSLAIDDVVTPPANGEVVIELDGSVTYTPDEGFIGTDTFEVSIDDGNGGSDISTVTVVVAPDDNLPPDAADDDYEVPADAPSELPVLDNDSDPNGDAIVIVDVVQPTQGTVSIIVVSGETRLVFTPNAGASGTDRFTYTISDGRGGESVATVTLTFPGGNRPPIAVGESVVTPEDTAVLIVVLANDTDPDGDALEVDSFTVPPRHGTVVIDAGGGVLYTPDADYNGADVFTYRMCDARGACDEAVVSLEVTPVNDAPRANDDFHAVPDLEASILDVVANDSDPELDLLTVTEIVTPPTRGQAFVNPDGTVTYEAAGAGSDSFVYRVCDEGGLCDVATVTVFVGDNTNPIAEDDEATTVADEPVTIDVLDNDSDPEGDPLEIGIVEDPAHGTATIEDGQVVYTPDEDFVGTDIFFYTVCDDGGACTTAFVVVDVTPGENTPPTAVDDTVSTVENTPVTFDSTLNDFDVDGDTLTVIAVGDPGHGVVTINADGTLTYSPDPGYVGEDTFTVTISDGEGGTSTQNVLVEVTSASNRPPDAVDDSYDAPSDVDTPLPVLDNDSDPEGDPLTIVDVVQPQHGTVAIAADGTLILTPAPAYIGPDRFSYTITDSKGGYDTANVDLYIGDRDRDGLGDGHEVTVTLTDPDDFDSDGDGVGDGDEIAGGDPLVYDEGVDIDPLDADTDDDGLSDGTELEGDGPLDGATDPLDPDTDGDGVNDGVEVGVTEPVAPGVTDGSGVPFVGTDIEVWVPDADPATETDPNDDDSDDDGLLDGTEDANGNGAVDGEIGVTGTPGTGETDPGNRDTDGDGIQDGTELGVTEPEGTGTDLAVFEPDLDPTTKTDPRDTDTDDGGVEDGDEDLNFNGYQDPGEIDPNKGADDVSVPLDFVAEGGAGCNTGAAGLLFGLFGLLALWVRRRR